MIMASRIKEAFGLVKKTYDEFSEDDCMTMGGALAFYTIFSLPPILLVVITIAGWFIGTGQAKQQVMEQAKTQMGPQVGQQLENVQTQQQQGTGTLATVLGVIAAIFGATGIMTQLQSAMDKAWEVRPDPKRSVIKSFAIKRALSFAMIVVIAILLLASMVLSALLNGFGATISQQTGVNIPGPLWAVVNELISLLVITLLFATIFKVLPDAKIAWRDVWVGAAVTALLFVIGKYLLGLYLGRAGVGSPYGAAGSLVLLLVWVYYSSLIFLFGVEFTQVWTRRHGSQIQPATGAVMDRQDDKTVAAQKS
jgi:membrane protein